MSTHIEYAGIPLDGSPSTTRALRLRLSAMTERLATVAAPPEAPVEDRESLPPSERATVPDR